MLATLASDRGEVKDLMLDFGDLQTVGAAAATHTTMEVMYGIQFWQPTPLVTTGFVDAVMSSDCRRAGSDAVLRDETR